MAWNYHDIKTLAKNNGGSIKDYIALSQQRDPFYIGTPTQQDQAAWFGVVWQKYGYNSGVHLRRIHYQIVSQETPVKTHDGQIYENTEKAWLYLTNAALYARYLGIVDPSCFVDRRAGVPTINFEALGNYVYCGVNNEDAELDISLPDIPPPPGYSLDIHIDQPYQVEIWTEKSTMNDIILPLCSRYGANLVSGVGEISLTHAELLIQRIQQNNKPCRILYVSDFDPAGQSMPVAAARKIEYFIRTLELNSDVKLLPVVLTKQQCVDYKLPRTPIKETEKRAGTFENRHGSGATELDAMEALYPGELKKVLEAHILSYYDVELENNKEDTYTQLAQQLQEVSNDVTQEYQTEYLELLTEYNNMRQTIEAQTERLRNRLIDLYQQISNKLDEHRPYFSSDTLPEPMQERANGKALFDTNRPYVEQIKAYKHFQKTGN